MLKSFQQSSILLSARVNIYTLEGATWVDLFVNHAGTLANNKNNGPAQRSTEAEQVNIAEDTKSATSASDACENGLQSMSEEKTLKDAVKPKNKRKKRPASGTNAS